MREFEIKRGMFKRLEGDGLRSIVEEVFGSVRVDGEYVVVSFGALKEMRVRLSGTKAILVDTVMNRNVDDDTAAETLRRYNEFLYRVTGFTTKERKKRLMASLKREKAD